MGTFIQRLLRIEPGISLGQWFYDRITNNWALLVAMFGGSGMSYLAAISEWIKPWGPVGYGGVGLIAALLTYLGATYGYAAIGKGRERAAQAEYINNRTRLLPINILAPIHTHERIELVQFYNHFFTPIENVRFDQCELVGPASIILEGCNLDRSQFVDCEVVIVRPDRPIRGAAKFRYCTILNSKVFRATFFMSHQAYLQLPDAARSGLVVISDGRIGDV